MQDAYAAYGMEHPDFVLLKEKDRRSICCLLLDGAADDALGALAPMNEFHVYRCGGQTAVVSRIIYTLVALSALWCVSLLFRTGDETEITARND